MTCYKPLKGWRSKFVGASGKRAIVFNAKEAFIDMPVEVPCGQCVGCRLERSRQWAIRCMHEASLYEENCFITLTYNDENLPDYKSLDVKEFQDFIKRLRKRFGSGVRYFHCGEYGENFGRPHYHACLFNFNFYDRKFAKLSKSGSRLFTSDILDTLWNHKGWCWIGDVTFESAAYIARYTLKKVTGPKAEEHYDGRKPEYVTMSRRPGIGKGWIDKYMDTVYNDDSVIVRGKQMRPPKYYDEQFEAKYPSDFARLKIDREKKIDALKQKKPEEFKSKRVLAKEKVKILQVKNFKRSYEND